MAAGGRSTRVKPLSPPTVSVEGFARAAFASSSTVISSLAPSHLLYALEPASSFPARGRPVSSPPSSARAGPTGDLLLRVQPADKLLPRVPSATIAAALIKI